MLWGVGMRLVIVQRLRLFRLAQILAAFIAEGSAKVIKVCTAGALQLKSIPALLAKLGSFSVVEPTFHAFHRTLPPSRPRKHSYDAGISGVPACQGQLHLKHGTPAVDAVLL